MVRRVAAGVERVSVKGVVPEVVMVTVEGVAPQLAVIVNISVVSATLTSSHTPSPPSTTMSFDSHLGVTVLSSTTRTLNAPVARGAIVRRREGWRDDIEGWRRVW